jgi:hypothetical protein
VSEATVLEHVRFLVTERELWAGATRSFAIALILQLDGSASEVLFEISAAPIVLMLATTRFLGYAGRIPAKNEHSKYSRWRDLPSETFWRYE